MSQNDEGEAQPNNLLMFRAAVSNRFEDIAKCVSEDEYLRIFTMFESKRSMLQRVRHVMEKELLKGMEEDLGALVTDECMVEGMTKLAKLIEDTTVPSNIKLWRPPGEVSLHLRSLDAEKMKKECENLERYIAEMEKENTELKKDLAKKRDSVQSVGERMHKLLNLPFKISELEKTVKFNQESLESLYNNKSADAGAQQ